MADQGPSYPPNSVAAYYKLIGADMNSLADQVFTRPSVPFKTAILSQAQVRTFNASTSITNAQGTIYTQPAKGGTALYLSTATYTGQTGPGIGLGLTIANPSAAYGLIITPASDFYLSLSVAQGGAATLDFYIPLIILS